MQTTLSHYPQLFDETNRLIEKSLNYPATEHYAVDFYPVMNPKNFKNNHILYQQEVMAHVGLNLREIICKDEVLPVALLGGVAVKSTHRGKGHLKRLLNDVLKKHEKSVGIFILWSDLTELYKKFGFFPAGAFLDHHVDGIVPNNYILTKFKNLNAKDLGQIKKIYSKVLCSEYFTFKRADLHWEMIKKIDSTDLYISRNVKGDIKSYFCQGKGGDLKGVVHEVGYLRENREQVLNDLRHLRVWHPTLGQESCELKYLGLFRIGNPKILGLFLEQRSGGDLRLISHENNEVTFKFKKSRHTVPTSDFLQYIFGPFPPREFKSMACNLFFSGLDSI